MDSQNIIFQVYTYLSRIPCHSMKNAARSCRRGCFWRPFSCFGALLLMSRALCGTCYVITTISCHATRPSYGTIEANGIAIYGMHVHVVIKRDVVNQGGACVIVTNHQNGRQKTALLQKRAAFVAVLISRDT